MFRTITCRRRPLPLPQGFANHLIRVAPLVVVPAHDLDQIAVDDLGELEIDDGGARIADDVGRDERIARYAEHAGVALRFGFFREDLVHLVDAGRCAR